MATALTADAMLAALAKWGITPKFYRSDWRTHNRNAVQGFGPLYGFVVHNFGSDVSDANSLAYLYNGDLARGMPGPLSQFSITDDGQVWVIGWGTANHTGFMDKDLHALVLKDSAPRDKDFRPDGSDATGGGMGKVNPYYLGVEMTYGAAPTAAQRKSVVLLGAALMDALGAGYTGGSCVGHRECTTQRSDPVGVPMWQYRRDVDALLKAGPAGSQPTPAPTPPKETFLMALTDQQQTELYNRVMGGIPAGSAYKRTNADGSPARLLDSADGSSLRTLLESIASKVGAPVDVDEAALAAALAPAISDAITSAVAAGVPTDQLADAVVARLGEKLAPPAA